MTIFFAELNLTLARVREQLRARPGVAVTCAAFAVVIFLLQWAPVAGEYQLTEGFRAPAPRYANAIYLICAQYLLPALGAYLLAFLLAGAAGMLLADGTLPAFRQFERSGLRYGHHVFAMLVGANILLSLLLIPLLMQGGSDGAAPVMRAPGAGQMLLLVILQLLVQVYLMLWTMELVRGRGWTKAGLLTALHGLQQPAVLIAGLAFAALGLIDQQTLWFTLAPVADGTVTAVTAMPFALLLALVRALLLPATLLFLDQYRHEAGTDTPAPAEAKGGALPPARPVALTAGESAPADTLSARRREKEAARRRRQRR